MPKKKYKETRIYRVGIFPDTRKERDKLYRLLERTGFMKLILAGACELVIRKEIK